MPNTWEQDVHAIAEQWDFVIADGIYGHITNYAGTDDYCWQAVRNEFRLAGIIAGRDAAMRQSEEIMALPIEEFNRRIIIDLTVEFRRIERDILRLSNSQSPYLIPGYHAGFKDGVADVKSRIAEVLL